MGYSKVFLLTLSIIMLSVGATIAQQRFGGGLLLGFNASQLDGDQAAGYNKIGFSGGVRGIIFLTDRMDVSTDILFSEQGSQSSPNDYVTPFVFQLKYLEVPTLFNYSDWEKATQSGVKYYKVKFSGGFSYGRLFSSSVDSSFLKNHPPLTILNKNNISIALAASFYLSPHIGFTAKWTSAITDLFHQQSYANDPVLSQYQSLRGYFWTIQAAYLF